MTLPYGFRLLCLCAAAFFITQLAVAALISITTRLALHRLAHVQARSGARFVLVLRLLPATTAGFAVLGLCAPSYLLLEPGETAEQIGIGCVTAALLGALVCVSGLVRGCIRAARTQAYLRRYRDCGTPMFLLVGVLHPRILVSPAIQEALTPAEFGAAVRHEEAHGRSRDNLKRLLITITPDVLPFTHGFRRLDSAWRTLTEWAADDEVALASPQCALDLASALVRVSRMHAKILLPPLSTALLADMDELSTRVERLIGNTPVAKPIPAIGSAAACACAVASAVISAQPAALHNVHRLLEILAH